MLPLHLILWNILNVEVHYYANGKKLFESSIVIKKKILKIF